MSDSVPESPTADELHRTAQLAAHITNARFGDMDASDTARLSGYLVLIEAAKQMLHDEVRIARSFGQTWEQIGDALGITRQAAQQRFGDRS